MASCDSIFSSSLSERRWVEQMTTIFEKDLIIEIDKPPCVFRVPKIISDTKPEAYAPQYIGLGPYHRLRPEFYMMERQKLAAAKEILMPGQLQKFPGFVIDKLKELEPVIRSCYDTHLEHDAEALAWMLAIDSLYLLNLLNTYRRTPADVDPTMKKLVQDLFVLENQIPAILLFEIRKALHLSCQNCNTGLFNRFWFLSKPHSPEKLQLSTYDWETSLFHQFWFLSKTHSPLKLTEQREFMCDSSCVHLLAQLYNMIVNNRVIELPIQLMNRMANGPMPRDSDNQLLDVGGELMKAIGDMGIGGAAVQMHLSFIERVPWGRIFALFKKEQDGNVDPNVHEIPIPSATQLCQIGKIKFKLIDGGIRDVKFDEDGEERTFYLPLITLHADSEVILRNLAAYEAAARPGSTPEFAEYLDLMCGIVDTPKDAALLREAKIIEGSLTDEEIANLFNGITKTTGKSDNKSNIEMAVDKANEAFDNTIRMKAIRFLKILKEHVLASRKFFTVFLTIILLALLTLQAFCEVYGCSSHWFPKKLARAHDLGLKGVISGVPVQSFSM